MILKAAPDPHTHLLKEESLVIIKLLILGACCVQTKQVLKKITSLAVKHFDTL